MAILIISLGTSISKIKCKITAIQMDWKPLGISVIFVTLQTIAFHVGRLQKTDVMCDTVNLQVIKFGKVFQSNKKHK